jgi:hypothetical protein
MALLSGDDKNDLFLAILDARIKLRSGNLYGICDLGRTAGG